MNVRHPLGWTALHTAAINQKPEVIKILLENGADVNAEDRFVNVHRTAIEKGLHSLDGTFLINIRMQRCMNVVFMELDYIINLN